jgi:hypothetical protein
MSYVTPMPSMVDRVFLVSEDMCNVEDFVEARTVGRRRPDLVGCERKETIEGEERIFTVSITFCRQFLHLFRVRLYLYKKL